MSCVCLRPMFLPTRGLLVMSEQTDWQRKAVRRHHNHLVLHEDGRYVSMLCV